jgi:hypothetical protein
LVPGKDLVILTVLLFLSDIKIVVMFEVSSTAKSLEDFLNVVDERVNTRTRAMIARIITMTMTYLFFLIIC